MKKIYAKFARVLKTVVKHLHFIDGHVKGFDFYRKSRQKNNRQDKKYDKASLYSQHRTST